MLFYIKGTVAECQKFLTKLTKDTQKSNVTISTFQFSPETPALIPVSSRSNAISIDYDYRNGMDSYVIKVNSVFSDVSTIAIALDYHNEVGYIIPKIGIIPVLENKVHSEILQLNLDMDLKDIITLSEFA